MRRELRELPAGVVIGTRLRRICKCDCPLPGTYTVVRIGGSRKMAWADHDSGGIGTIVRANDFRDWSDRCEIVGPAATKEEP